LLHFQTEGILVQKGHETFISSCFLGQHSTVDGDPSERDFTGTTIDQASNNNAITDVAIFSAAVGGGIGILVKQGTALTRLDNCYLDYNSIVMEDPVQVDVTNGLFLGDGNAVLKSINGQISVLNIVDNKFNGDPKNMKPRVTLDGNFGSIDQVVIERNNAGGMSLKSTVGRLTVTKNRTKWVADFLSVLVFPNRINHFQYSFYAHWEAAPRILRYLKKSPGTGLLF
ncbi:hypothetical protein CFOL_v3_18329, partial [Cephalotus follicularis]